MVARGLEDCSVPSGNQPVCRAGLRSLRDAQSITTGLFLSLESGRQAGLPHKYIDPTLAQLRLRLQADPSQAKPTPDPAPASIPTPSRPNPTQLQLQYQLQLQAHTPILALIMIES